MNESTSTENSNDIVAPARKKLRERATELAILSGRSGQDVSKSDWEQAKRELTGEPGADPKEAILESVPGSGSSDPADGSKGRKISVTSNPEGEITEPQSLFALVAQQAFFKGLNPRHLQLLTDSALQMQFEPGQSIFEEKSPANRFYLILEGKVVLESEVADHGMIPLQTLGPGDELGWSWLFPPYYLHSSARALEVTRTIFFYGTRLREQCEQDHDLGYELMKRTAEVMIRRLYATQRRLIECTDVAKLSNLPGAL